MRSSHSRIVCEVCGVVTTPIGGACTNGRCRDCHRHCTAGGSTSPGHGRGDVATPHRGEVAPKRERSPREVPA